MNRPLNFKSEYLALDEFVQVDTVSRLNQSSQSLNILSPKPSTVSYSAENNSDRTLEEESNEAFVQQSTSYTMYQEVVQPLYQAPTVPIFVGFDPRPPSLELHQQ